MLRRRMGLFCRRAKLAEERDRTSFSASATAPSVVALLSGMGPSVCSASSVAASFAKPTDGGSKRKIE